MTESQQALRQQLESLDDLQSIVQTMKALAAASIRQYEQAVEALRLYERSVEMGLGVVLRRDGMSYLQSETLARPRANGCIAIVFGSDHGLCGRFNEQVVDHAKNDLAERTSQADQTAVLTVGMRAAGQLASQNVPVHKQCALPPNAQEITARVQDILQWVDARRRQQSPREVVVYANQPGEGADAAPIARTLLPLDLQHFQDLGRYQWPSRRQPVAFMDTHTLASSLIRQHLFVQLFQACAGSQASEQASRLSAMQSAESSLDERVDWVTNRHRRLRQNAITAELLDIVAGFEATQSE
mgnify:FL=1